MSTITKRQKEIYDYVKKYIEEKEYSPTFEEIKKHFRLKALSGVYQHVDALVKKGMLIKNEHSARGVELKKDEIIQVPLSGTISAGQPIEAIEMPGETIAVNQNEINRFSNLYALRVQGNSMIDEGIFDGDVVVIRKQEFAENGETVVAIIDDNEATLKKLYREKDRFRLQPCNPTLFPFYRKEVEIRGVVVKIIRNLQSPIKKEKVSDDELTRRIDYSWDFKGEKTKPYTHGFHTYPAMFIPQVAKRLLQNYSKEGDTICDIFCGSGTALIESRLLGRNSYGIDLNPLAIFLAKVKTTEIDPKKLTKEYFTLLDRIEKIKDKEIQRPNFFNIDFWFKEPVIIQLAKIKKAIKSIKDRKVRNFFLVCLSETVRLASNTKNGEFKLVRIKKDKLKDYNPDVLGIFKKKAELNINGMTEFYRDVNKKIWAKPIFGDSSRGNGIKANSIDCIITSPPYGDSRTTVAYGQFSRLSAQWIDIFKEPNKASGVDNELLGGKATKDLEHNLQSEYLDEVLDKISKKDEKRAKDVLSFYVDLNKCLERAYKILKPSKYFCLVIGNRLVKQVRIPTDFIITELGESVGFSCEDIVVRNIPGKRMPMKNSPTNVAGELEETMNKESIVILRKN
ncbi:transcriptional repressor LexA [Patescibacteria group bacterium]|nr:transcriptional repressor LexA [Patescibacteria group bacterium]MCG2693413.1 transcriptional repressor LexA [Candidatus Parcubacteria bacterium]